MRAGLSLLTLWALTLGAALAQHSEPPSAAPSDARDQIYGVPVTDGTRSLRMLIRVCRPASDVPARLVVINHGSPANPAERSRIQPGRCDQEAAQWFLARGYVVAFPLRRGYGATGGAWAEGYGGCDAADYVHAGLETARDIQASVDAITSLPFVRPSGVIVLGQSAGGWGTIAYDSVAHPKVTALIVMAGGRGGHLHDEPNHNCHPERLIDAAAHFGRTATTPMLWVYTENDSYFRPAISRELYRAFTGAGGRAVFEQPGRFDGEGHHLFFGHGGSAIWGPLVERYLAQQPSGE